TGMPRQNSGGRPKWSYRDFRPPENRNFIESSYFEIYQTKAEDIPAALRSVYRELGVDHGDGLWPFVTYKRWGYDEALPQGRHLLLLENALGNLFMQLRAVEAKPGSVGFTKGEMCVRFYSPDQGMWVNAAMPYALPPRTRRSSSSTRIAPT
ncbi:MAG: hypothetical protein ACLUNZ_12385, partial [Evtepia sp.]